MISNDALRDCSNTASQTSMDNSQQQQQQRKRPASPLNTNEAASKRSKPSNADDEDNTAAKDNEAPTFTTAQQHDDIQNTSTCQQNTTAIESSVEHLLSVPLEIVFRQAASGAHKRKPLLTRAEAQCLVKTAQLAHEVDVIVQVSSEALSRQVWCTSFAQTIQGIPLLRSVLPILSVHGNDVTSSALTNVQGELERALLELQACASGLRQYSEQNWTLSESLLDAVGNAPSSGQELAREKRMIAEIQEEVCTRIDALLNMSVWSANDAADTVEDAFQQATDPETGQFVSMQQYCCRLFGIEVAPETVASEEEEEVGNDNSSSSDTNEDGEQQKSARPEQKQHEPRNPLLALAQEAEERGNSQWSGSTVTIHTPEHHSPMRSEHDDAGRFDMTQGTSNAVAALTVLASGGFRDSRRLDEGDE